MKEGIQYGLKTTLGKVIPLGEPGQFNSIEEVKKLRVVKDKPDWEVVVVEKPQKKQKQKRVYNSNRWAIVYPDSVVYLSAVYASKTDIMKTCVIQPPAKLVKYPKDHYHKEADKWFTKQLLAQKLVEAAEKVKP